MSKEQQNVNMTLREQTLGGAPGSAAFPFLRLRPRHKWFASSYQHAEMGWFGPCATFEAAIMEQACEAGPHDPIYVAQGYKLTKAERDEWGTDFDWQVDTHHAIKVCLPNSQVSNSGRRLSNEEENLT